MAYLYPKNIEAKIGFDAIRAELKGRCQSPIGAVHVEEMTFSSDNLVISENLFQTFEMKQMMERGEDYPEISFNNLGYWLPNLKTEGSYASPEEFLRLAHSISSFDRARTFFLRREGKDEDSSFIYPCLARLFSQLSLFPDLGKSIGRIIDKTGTVKDSASPDLAEVRQKLSSMQGSIARAIQRIYTAAVKEGIADKDSSPTFRDGRMVIPVPAGNKRGLRGIIHDESASGKTVFIEPAETVELSNRMRELELEEQRIIVRILINLADETRPFIDSIIESNTLLGRIDFIMAKAKFAIDAGGELPNISKRPEIDWYGAVHPTLFFSLQKQGKSIIPLNIRLEGKKRILIISGPNAGGKSVALKTVGIVQYMTQCGLLPTIYANSHIGFFNKIFIDIGDEQSMENDLSTYSSHLRNMRQFLLHADGKSLILIDEIGSGTEPNIGSALAKAILAALAKTRCYGVVTTHYHNLKRFAEEDESFVNGAMLYDRQKLQPTFQLSIGHAGSSFALEIAGKIGLPKHVIDAAKEDVGEEYVESDRFMMEIARDRKYWQTKRESIKERENRLEALEQKYEKLISDLNQKRKEIIKEAQDEARNLLAGTNKKIENTIMEIRKAEAERERTKEIRKELEEFKQDVERADETTVEIKFKIPKKKRESKKTESLSLSQPPFVATPPNPAQKGELVAGEYAKMTGSNTIGKILSVEGKEAEVAFGNLRTKVKLTRLTWVPKPLHGGQNVNSFTLLNPGGSDETRLRQLNFRDELDIRGARADEALDKVAHFIDDAIQFGMRKVRILHGTGAGILRQLVRQQLQATPGVTKFEDEDVRLGGAGITVVSLA